MAQATTVYGIDLGTTYSCISYVDEFGKPVTIANVEGDYITPSVVFFDGSNRIVGHEAKSNSVLYPSQVVSMVKRHMGEERWFFPYDGVEYSAEEISSYILKKLVEDAATAGHTVTDVVITCPAYFGISERDATTKAGEIAGVNVRSIINEPTAAAIAYGLHSAKDQVVLVYDLGGGTFDITMIDIRAGAITVIATGGHHHLGGRNWDDIVVDYLAEQWSVITGNFENLRDDLETLQELYIKAELAKRSLSNPARPKTDVSVSHAGKREKVTLTRQKFDELTDHLLTNTIEYTRKMLAEAEKKGYSHFDKILLVGGSTRMLQVAERLKSEFGVEPELYEPDEAVAKGAALYGQKLAIGDAIQIIIAEWSKQGKTPSPNDLTKAKETVADEYGLTIGAVEVFTELSIKNVLSRSFGVVALDEHKTQAVSNLAFANDEVPLEVTQRFGTETDNQQNVEIRIMENLSSDLRVDLADSQYVRDDVLDLPAGLPAHSPIEITFRFDEQGRLYAIALEPSSGKNIDLHVETKRVISQEKFEEAKQRSGELVYS